VQQAPNGQASRPLQSTSHEVPEHWALTPHESKPSQRIRHESLAHRSSFPQAWSLHSIVQLAAVQAAPS
jgi:hypothetical protein